MRTAFVPMIGRLGNNLFIYAWARAWCELMGYELCMDPWIGEKIFTIPEANRTRNADKVFPELYYQDQASLIYTRKQVREWFTFKPEILEGLQAVPKADVLLNVREAADHRGAGHVCISRTSYQHACTQRGYDYGLAQWETDTNPIRLPGFDGDMWAGGSGTTVAAIPSFYRLMTAKVLFRANSSFSWWAATFGHGKIYSPVIKGLPGGVPDIYCPNFSEGNWPQMTTSPINTDLFLKEE